MEPALNSTRERLATVRRYAPGERQAPHRDSHSRASLVLSGALSEEGPSGSLSLGPGDVLLKSRRIEHEDRFGEAGAIILSLEFADDDPFDQGEPPWRKRDDLAAVRLAALLLEAAAADDRLALGAIGLDLVSGDDPESRSARPPAWLLHLKAELESVGLAAVDVASRAQAAGVHAAHASRLFRRCFGVSITEHAQLHAVRRAIAEMSLPRAVLSDVAVAAGFYDQSHMIRVFRRVTGGRPGRLRALALGLVRRDRSAAS